MDTNAIKEMFDCHNEYSVFEPWLKANGYTLADLPLTATTEDGKDVIVEAFSLNSDIVWMITTLQDNGWTRINIYYKDGTVEEMYKREEL